MHTSFAAAEAAAEAQPNSSRGQPGAAGGLRWSGLCSMSLGLAATVMRRVPVYASLQPDPKQVWTGGMLALPQHCNSVLCSQPPACKTACCTGGRSQKAASRQASCRRPTQRHQVWPLQSSFLIVMRTCSSCGTCTGSCTA